MGPNIFLIYITQKEIDKMPETESETKWKNKTSVLQGIHNHQSYPEQCI